MQSIDFIYLSCISYWYTYVFYDFKFVTIDKKNFKH